MDPLPLLTLDQVASDKAQEEAELLMTLSQESFLR